MRKIILGCVLALLVAAPTIAALNTAQITVTTSETSLVAATPFRQDVAIANRGATAIFIGPTGVTTANGFRLNVDATISLTALANTEVFGIVAVGTEPAHVIRKN